MQRARSETCRCIGATDCTDRPRPIGGTAHVSVHGTELPRAWGGLSLTPVGLRRARRVRRSGCSLTRSRGYRSTFQRTASASVVVWLFTVRGMADLLLAFYQGLFGGELDARMLGAACFMPTAVVPPFRIMHGLIFWRLVRPRQSRLPPPRGQTLFFGGGGGGGRPPH